MAGGAEQQLVELLSSLDRRRFQPYVICLYASRLGYSLHFLEDLKQLGISIVVFDLGKGKLDKLVAVIRLAFLIRGCRPDIVQTNNYHSNFLLRLVRLLGLRFKLVSGIYVEYTEKQWRYERLSSWLSQVLVCNSPHLEKHLRNRLKHRHVALIPNGVDLRRFGGSPALSGKQAHELNSSMTLLMLGRIVQQKAPQLLVEALRILKMCGQLPERLNVRIVGEVQEAHVQTDLNARIHQYGLSSHFVQLPATHTPQEELDSADVLVLTSLWEGLPGVMLEALAVGRPVLISDAANRAGVIQDGVNGWVFRTADAEDLAKHVAMICSMSRAQLAEMFVACRESVAPFASSQMVQQYEMLYRSLTARV